MGRPSGLDSLKAIIGRLNGKEIDDTEKVYKLGDLSCVD
jgi:hypothetical protein